MSDPDRPARPPATPAPPAAEHGGEPAADPRTIRLDALRIRGIAHPLRIRILDLLRRRGPATATMLAERLGQSSGATSYHLRQLATYGFIVEEVGHGKGRERWWRAAHQTTRLDESSGVDLDDAEPYLRAVVESHAHKAQTFIADLPALAEEWRHAFSLNYSALRLTPEEALRLIGELNDVVARYRTDDVPDAPEDARVVSAIFHVLPEDGDRA